MKVKHKFMVGAEDSGRDCSLSNKGLLDTMTNMASLHAHIVNQGYRDSGFVGLGWVVLNWRLEITGRRPIMCSDYFAVTWPREYTRAFADRDFEFYDEYGSLFAIGSSRWAAINLEKRGLVRLTDEMMESYGIENEQVFADKGFRKTNLPVGDPIKRLKTSITRNMIDCYGHTHNTAYLDLAEQVIPDDIDTLKFNSIDVIYKKEIPPMAFVTLEYYNENENCRVLIKDNESQILHADILLCKTTITDRK